MQWYYAVGDQRHGPVEQAEFERLVANGTIRHDTLVWQQGMAQWQPYATVAGGATPPPVVDDGTEVCAVSGKRYPRREMINYEGKWISAEHRDLYFQRLREGVAQPGEGAVPGPFGYGGFWIRVAARIIDGLAQSVVLVPLMFIGLFMIGMSASEGGGGGEGAMAALLFQVMYQLVAMVIGLAYDVFFIRKYDATPGKMAVGLKLLRSDGSKLSIGRIIGRHFAHFISALPLGIGYIVAGSDEQKRTFHDRICDTRVIRVR